jgi:hypothetical protein
VLAHDLKIPPHPSRPRWRLRIGYPFEVFDDKDNLSVSNLLPGRWSFASQVAV